MLHSWFTESGWFLNINQDLSSFLRFIEHSLKGQRTGNHEVQYRAKIKREEAMKYSPLELNYFWLIPSNEFFASINQREQKQSHCWERIIILALCEGKTHMLIVPAHESVLLLIGRKTCFQTQRGPVQPVWQHSPILMLWAQASHGSPSSLQSKSLRMTQSMGTPTRARWLKTHLHSSGLALLTFTCLHQEGLHFGCS